MNFDRLNNGMKFFSTLIVLTCIVHAFNHKQTLPKLRGIRQDNAQITPKSIESSLFANNPTSVSSSANTPPYKLSKPQSVYVALTSLFVTCLIVADVIGVKIFELTLPFKILGINKVEHTCGMLTFPITFLLGDIINEYYGPQATKNTVYLGLVMSVLVFFIMNVAQALPYLDKPFNGKAT